MSKIYRSNPFGYSSGSFQSSGTFSLFDEDDSFWSDYNKLGDAYKKQLDPLLNFNYKFGFWDKLGNFFGFNTGEDKYKMQLQDRARQALSQLQSESFQNSFNDEESKASRMRDAGLNPDLSGQVEGESASEFDQPLSNIDPSIFDPPSGLIPDLTSVLSAATTGLTSVGTFMKLCQDIGVVKSTKVGLDIKNYSDALSAAGDFLATDNPFNRFPELLNDPNADVTSEDFFNQRLVPSVINSVDSIFSHLPKNTREYMRKALTAQSKNPEIYSRYFENASKAIKNRVEYSATKQAHGSLNLVDEAFDLLNKDILEHRVSSMKAMYELTDIVHSYNILKASNDLDFEQFKKDKHLPENMVEANLQNYIKEIAQAKADASIERMRLNFVKHLDDLYNNHRDEFENNTGAKYFYYSLISKFGFAPLLNSSLGSSVLGSASWQRPFLPDEPAGLGLFPAGSVDNLIDTGQNNPYWNDLK